MANGRIFDPNFPEPASLPQHDSELCFGDDVTMLDVTDQAFGFTMDTRGYLSVDDTACLPAHFPMDIDFSASNAGVTAIPDSSAFQSTSNVHDLTEDVSWALGSGVDTGGHLSQDYSTHSLPRSHFNADFGSGYDNGMALLNAPVLQSIPHVEFIPKTAEPSYHLPLEIPDSELEDVHMLEAPVVHATSSVYDRAISEKRTTSVNIPMRTRYATAEDWEHNRALFTRLYCDENKTLNEVRSIMKERHGFHATDKMYKKRINDWQLRKKFKASEKEEILRSVETNKKLGVDLGEPMVSGRIIKKHLIERYCKEKRKARSPSSNSADPTTTAGNGGQSAKRTPPGRPKCSALISFSRIKDPTDYRNYEALIFYVDQYYNSKLEKDPLMAWNAWDKSSSNWRTKISYTFQGKTYTCALDGYTVIFDRLDAVNHFLAINRTREAWRMIEEAAEMVRPVIFQQPPALVGHLLVHLSRQPTGAYSGVRMQVLHLISDMAVVAQGKRHPFSNLCRLIQMLHGKRDVIDLALRKLRDVLRERLGQNHFASLLAQEWYCFTLLSQKRYDELERSLYDLMETFEHFQGRSAFSTRSTLYWLARLCYLTYRGSEAEDILVDVLQRGKEWGRGDPINVVAMHLRGQIWCKRGDYRAAEAIFWSALSDSLLHHGPRDPVTLRLWIDFQECYQTSASPTLSSDALPEISEEPIRCFSRPRSSSLPPMDGREYEAGFWYEAPA